MLRCEVSLSSLEVGRIRLHAVHTVLPRVIQLRPFFSLAAVELLPWNEEARDD